MKSSKQIYEVFAELEPPRGRVTGHDCEECDEVDSKLRGRTWQSVARDFPAYCHDAFPLLTPAAQRYYLPAYMLTAIGPEANLQGNSLESALEDGRLTSAMFTIPQQAAIASWIVEYWNDTFNETPPNEILGPWIVQG